MYVLKDGDCPYKLRMNNKVNAIRKNFLRKIDMTNWIKYLVLHKEMHIYY